MHILRDAAAPSGKRIESLGLIDRVDSNINYYYCFRAVDKNGYLSNPSPVLKVQMVDDNGRIYPIIEPYDFSSMPPRKSEMSFKRYIEIDTSLEERQVLPPGGENATTAGIPSQAPIGSSIGTATGVFDPTKTYKVRIISKDTGRKIDLNLNFNVETIPNPNLPGN
jgi:hypothetical protein